ncbi:MAG: hypothetical protein GF364_01665, partial [Candidatus Lokiarchaeota archaeon]|nr:hypothetical protein [Candidatus Lokiarchaeota archaeon]
MPSDLNIEKLFGKIISNLEIDPSKHLNFNELSKDQEKILDKAEDIFKENLNGEVKKFGGKLNEEEFKKVEDEINKRLENDMFKEERKNLDKLIKKWLDLQKELLNEMCFGIFPLKDMPFPSVSFLRIPRIIWKKGKIDKMDLNTDGIAYAGEIKALVTRTTLYGTPPKKDPLFAPHIGPLDLAGYKPDPEDKAPKNENPRFLYEVIKALDRKTTRNQVTRYDDQYERHGEPICDFLIKDEDLMKSLSKIKSAIDSKRQTSSSAIPAIILTLMSTSLVIVCDENSRSQKYENAFEALIKLAAASYETPNVKKTDQIESQAAAMTQAAQANTPPGQGIGSMTPQGGPSSAPSPPPQSSGPQLPVWTEEELAEEAKKRGGPATNLPVWTEDELAEESK